MELLNHAYQSNADLWLRLKNLLAEREVLIKDNTASPRIAEIDDEINNLKQNIKASSQILE
jgi:hypothetical protein